MSVITNHTVRDSKAWVISGLGWMVMIRKYWAFFPSLSRSYSSGAFVGCSRFSGFDSGQRDGISELGHLGWGGQQNFRWGFGQRDSQRNVDSELPSMERRGEVIIAYAIPWNGWSNRNQKDYEMEVLTVIKPKGLGKNPLGRAMNPNAKRVRGRRKREMYKRCFINQDRAINSGPIEFRKAKKTLKWLLWVTKRPRSSIFLTSHHVGLDTKSFYCVGWD